MKFFISLLLVFSTVAGLRAQVSDGDSLSIPYGRDSLTSPVTAEDIKKAVMQEDSSGKFLKTLGQIFGMRKYMPDEKPKVAFVRSLFLPGWGQITNKDYWKAGIVYGAAGAGWYFGIRSNQRQYEKYLGHYSRATFVGRGDVYFSSDNLTSENALPVNSQFYIANNGASDTFYARTDDGSYYTLTEKKDKGGTIERYYLATKANVSDEDVIGAFGLQTFASAKNQYRRWRDASYIGFAAGWLFFALEANVAAHLKTFDMSEDISMRFEPAGPQTFGMQASGLKLAFVFD